MKSRKQIIRPGELQSQAIAERSLKKFVLPWDSNPCLPDTK